VRAYERRAAEQRAHSKLLAYEQRLRAERAAQQPGTQQPGSQSPFAQLLAQLDVVERATSAGRVQEYRSTRAVAEAGHSAEPWAAPLLSFSHHVQPTAAPFEVAPRTNGTDLLGWLLDQGHEPCPTAVLVDGRTGEMTLGPRCRRATCRPCARLDAARQAAAVQFVAKARMALTLTELAERGSDGADVWPTAQRAHTAVLRHLRRAAGPTEWTFVVQRGPESGMVHSHAAVTGWTPDHTRALHQIVASLGIGPRVVVQPIRNAGARGNYLFAEVRKNLPLHLALNNPRGSPQLQLAHHSRGFYGMPLDDARQAAGAINKRHRHGPGRIHHRDQRD
jgi:hypothetical protein